MSSNLNNNPIDNNNLLLGNVGAAYNYNSSRVKSASGSGVAGGSGGGGGSSAGGQAFLYGGVNGSGSGVLQFTNPPPSSNAVNVPLATVQPPPQHSLGGGGGGAPTNNSAGGGKTPQTQIMSGNRNKCLNEKRRREQENIYIEELAELISASIEDMSSLSVKPDKCAILQETVNQIRRIKASEEVCSSSIVAASSNTSSSSSSSSTSIVATGTEGGGGGAAAVAAAAGQVQQGEVSSSTNILATEILCPLVLEALDGFLFVVNGDGIVEFVSENVCGFINFVPADLVGKSIYNVIHLTDHARFSSSLLPMSIPGGWNNNQQGDQESSPKHQRTFNIRVLTKSDRSDPGEDPSLSSHYENMQITAMLMPPNCSPQPSTSSTENRLASTSQSGSSLDTRLVCIARRLPPNERAPGLPVEQFTTKIQPDGHIIGLDTSGLTAKWSGYLKKEQLVNTLIQELVCEIPKFCAHLRETLKNGSATSAVYRMKFGDKVVMVQTKSKVFAFNPNTEPDFIMATHTIIQNDSDGGENAPSTPQTPNPQTPRSTPTPTTSQAICPSPSAVVKKQPPTPTSASSTPLLPSPHPHVQDSNNNENNHVSPSNTQGPSSSSSSSNFQTLTLQSQYDDFSLDLWGDFDLDSNFTGASDVPTPAVSQPPTTTTQAPVTRVNQPIASPVQPNLAATWGVTNSPLSTSSQNSPFPNDQTNTNDLVAAAVAAQQHAQSQQQQQQQQQQQNAIGSDRLRNLLTVNPLAPRNDNKILKTLLNAADEQEEQPNNMLLKLLNNNATAQEPITRGTELLQQLLNEDTPNTPGTPNTHGSGLKRSFSTMMEENKWTPQQPILLPPPPSQNVKGDLCKRNPRLVSLLQKPSDPPSSVPQVPQSYLSITPQEKMKIRAQTSTHVTPLSPQQHFARNNLLNNLLNNNNRVASPSATQSRSTPSPSHHHAIQLQSHAQVIPAAGTSSTNASQSPLLGPTTPTQHYDSNDAILDEILDQVIDIVPEDLKLLSGDISNSNSHVQTHAHSTLLAGNQNQIPQQNNTYYSDDVSNILNLLESNADIPNTLLTTASAAAAAAAAVASTQQASQTLSPSSTHTPSDIAKIDAIQKELMQFETIQQITTTFHNQANSPAPPSAPVTPTSSSVPLLISRTTTTSTIARFQSPPNRVVPNHQQQTQQLMNMKQQQQQQLLLQRQALNSQGQRVLQNPAIIQQLQELRNRNSTVNLQNLDSLLSGNVPPPNVTLTSNGTNVFNQQQVVQHIQTQQQQQQAQAQNHGGIITGSNVLISGNIQTQQQQQQQQLMQQQQQLLRLNVQQQQQQLQHSPGSQAPSYNPITSLTQSNQLNQRIVMNNQQAAWINQNKARISIQQQNNPMLNAQLGALTSSGISQQQGITANIQHQLLLRQQQQQNFQAQQPQQQQQQFIFNRVRTAGATTTGVQQQVVTQQQLLQQQQQQQQLQMTLQQQQVPGGGPVQQQQQISIQSGNLLLQGAPQLNSGIDVRPNLRAVLGNRTLLQGSSPLVVVSSSSMLSSPVTAASGVPDLDALGFPSTQPNNTPHNSGGGGGNSTTGGGGGGGGGGGSGGGLKVSI